LETKHIYLTLIMSSYYFTHSFFLHPPVKKFFIEKLSFSFRAYRILFNVFATLGLVIIYLYSKEINDPLWVDYLPLKLLGVAVIFLGVFVTYKSFENYNLKEFVGLTSESTDTLQNNLVIDGYHRFVRHPVYFATLLIFLGYLLYSPTLTSLIYLIVTLFYLQIGIHLEEIKLIAKFGGNYVNYRSEVPKLFPFAKKKR